MIKPAFKPYQGDSKPFKRMSPYDGMSKRASHEAVHAVLEVI